MLTPARMGAGAVIASALVLGSAAIPSAAAVVGTLPSLPMGAAEQPWGGLGQPTGTMRPASPFGWPAGDPITSSGLWSRPGADGAPRRWLVVLEGPTVADLLLGTRDAAGGDQVASGGGATGANARAGATGANARAVLSARQAPALAYLDRVGADVVSVYDAALSGFLVDAPAEPELLWSTPGVVGVYPAPEVRVDLDYAVPLIGAEAVAALPGVTGEGIHIAILDTGVDYTHEALGGTGTAMAYSQNGPGTVEPGTFPTVKVIGGYDFAGSMYGSGQGPSPDPDPLDEQGHGTHVAGIAAGMQTASIHRGVASDAKLVALKIFGRSGSTDLVLDGIEWAIESNLGLPVPGTAARVDVLNMSLGSPWSDGILGFVGAIERATAAGIVVVASAGNSGAVGFVTGSPGSSPFALSVASTVAGGGRADMVRATVGTQATDLEALEADAGLAPPVRAELSAPLVDYGRGCNADPRPSALDGIALIERGACTFREKIANAQADGALGALVYTVDQPLTVMGTDGSRVGIPALMVSGTDGLNLRQALQEGEPVTVLFSPIFRGAWVRTGNVDVISSFSSRGPSRSGELKPNIAAPGSAVRAAGYASGDRAAVLSGTSMASPMVAGGAAVVLERLRALYPDATAVDVGAMLVNSAHPLVWLDQAGGVEASTALGGTGRLALEPSVRVDATLMGGEDEPFSLNMGIGAFLGARRESASALVTNLSDQSRRFRIEVASDERPGLAWDASPPVIEVAPRESVAVDVSADLDTAGWGDFQAHGGACSGVDRCLRAAEVQGRVVAREVDEAGTPVPGGNELHLPVYALPRPASQLSVDVLSVGESSGVGQAGTRNNADVTGRAEIFHLLARDGAENDLADRLDVDVVGVRAVTTAQGKRLDFLVHTREARRVPIDARVAVVLDVDRDGELDKALFNYDIGLWLSEGAAGSDQPTGEQGAIVADVRSRPFLIMPNNDVPSYYADVELDSRTVILSADARTLGFPEGAPIEFDAVVLVEAAFADVIAGGRSYSDAVPDDGLRAGSLGTGRVSFAEDSVGWAVAPWSTVLGPGVEAQINLAADPARLPSPILVALPWDLPAADLIDTTVRVGDVPPPAPSSTDTPSATASPTDSAPTGSPTPTGSPDATASAPTPTGATPTLWPPSPTGTPEPTRTPTPTSTFRAIPTLPMSPEPTLPPRAAPRGAYRAYLPLGLVPSTRR